MNRAAAIYVRISDDREGAGLGVERQEKDCRDTAARLGWDVVAVFVDNDLTAFTKSRRYKRRGGYEQMMDAVKDGQVRGILAWHTDRLHRTPRELEDFIDIAEAHDLSVETVKAGIVDLRTPAGQAVARTLCAWAYYESAHKSERIRAKYVQLAEQGLPGNGGYRPFGYTKDRLSLVPEEAAYLRWAYSQVLAGRALRRIAIELTEQGVLSTQGKPWSLQALRYNLLAGRNAGLREHKGIIVGPATWPPIVDRATWEAARAILQAPERRSGDAASAARRYLLTGFLHCGRCGSRLVPRITDAKGQRRYGCPPSSDGGCGGTTLGCNDAHGAVERLLFARLERDADLTPDTPPDLTGDLLARIAADEQRLDALGAAFADDPDANPLEMRAAGARIRKRIAATRAELATMPARRMVHDPLQVRDAWPGYDLSQKRHVLGSVIERIDVGRGKPGRFDPDRLQVTWR